MTKEKEVLARGFDHLSSLAMALKKIQENTPDEKEAIQKSAPLSMVFRAINDVLHPLYGNAQELFPENDLTEFLKVLNQSHKEAVEKKIFPPCPCSSCPKVTDESTSGNTTQAE